MTITTVATAGYNQVIILIHTDSAITVHSQVDFVQLRKHSLLDHMISLCSQLEVVMKLVCCCHIQQSELCMGITTTITTIVVVHMAQMIVFFITII